MTKQVTLTRVKTTPGTIVFATNESDAVVKSQYVQKGCGFDDAKTVTVTVTTEP